MAARSGLNIRWPDTPLDQEERLLEHKLDAARAYARANGLDRTVIDGPGRRLGIVTTGKSYLDVRQALDDLGIDEGMARRLGLALYKVGMSWPLEPDGIRRFAGGSTDPRGRGAGLTGRSRRPLHCLRTRGPRHGSAREGRPCPRFG